MANAVFVATLPNNNILVANIFPNLDFLIRSDLFKDEYPIVKPEKIPDNIIKNKNIKISKY